MSKGNTSPVMTFAEAASMIERKFGFKPSVSTVWRWAKKGVNGRVLEAIRIGRRYRTTAEAIERFLNRTPQVDKRSDPDRTALSSSLHPAFSKTEWAEARASIAREAEESKRQLSKYRPSKTQNGKGGAR